MAKIDFDTLDVEIVKVIENAKSTVVKDEGVRFADALTAVTMLYIVKSANGLQMRLVIGALVTSGP